MIVALIADIVGSRKIVDRARAQAQLEAALRRAEDALPAFARPTRSLVAVVGDELQGTFADLRAALAATLLQRLALPDGIDVRFGVGVGQVIEIPSAQGTLTEGSAWWAARAAIEQAEALSRRDVPQLRTWVAAAPDAVPADLVRIANAGLLTRDRIIGRWSSRVRRLVYGRITGATQGELADAEGITQSAVSQTLSAAGATAIIRSFEELSAPAD